MLYKRKLPLIKGTRAYEKYKAVGLGDLKYLDNDAYEKALIRKGETVIPRKKLTASLLNI